MTAMHTRARHQVQLATMYRSMIVLSSPFCLSVHGVDAMLKYGCVSIRRMGTSLATVNCEVVCVDDFVLILL